eukprot:scaffold109762_cov13-Tisochrysis_lutea.AAC.1
MASCYRCSTPTNPTHGTRRDPRAWWLPATNSSRSFSPPLSRRWWRAPRITRPTSLSEQG